MMIIIMIIIIITMITTMIVFVACFEFEPLNGEDTDDEACG